MALLFLIAAASTGCFEPSLPSGTQVRCVGGADCPESLVCLAGACVTPALACITVEGKEALPRENGLACDDEGRICVAGECVEPRCGDGITTAPERCDGEDGCRSDCTRCGDGFVDIGEACDDGVANDDEEPGACRTSCEFPRCGDGVIDPGEGCDEGLANSDAAPSGCRLNCAPYSCGDAVLDDREACDDGDRNSDELADTCRSTCALPSCGDGVIDTGEECDDGFANSDTRPNTCRRDCRLPRCGDGTVDVGEACDEGARNSDATPNACRTVCERARCGDGVVDRLEQCDDGDANSDDSAGACRTTCTSPRCGDGVVDVGEECDDGIANDNGGADRCRESCVLPRCGDGIIDSLEECDDGPLNDDTLADSCRTTCALPACGDGIMDGDEECDQGTKNADDVADSCRTDCRLPMCGDAMVDTDEECDDGNANSDTRVNACRLDCRGSRCGDGTVDSGETCDDGPSNSDTVADACRTSCIPAECGDGVVDSGEGCDDGNTVGADGCSASCMKFELCGDRVVDEGESCDDGNHNPADGCDRCQGQYFFATEIISGDAERGTSLGTPIANPSDVAMDESGRIYFTEPDLHRIRRLELNGSITNVMGMGIPSLVRDGIRASVTGLESPNAIALDSRGNVYAASSIDGWVVFRNQDGKVRVAAGDGSGTYTVQDRTDSRGVPVGFPVGLAVDGSGRIYVTDSLSYRLLRIDTDYEYKTLAGYIRVPCTDASSCDAGQQCSSGYCRTGTQAYPFGPGMAEGPPGESRIGACRGIDVDEAGNVLLADTTNHAVLHVDTEGFLTVRAGGNGVGSLLSSDFAEGQVNATDAKLSSPRGVAWDGAGGYFIADTGNNLIVHVDDAGIARVVAGTGIFGFNGDGEGLTVNLSSPRGLSPHNLGGILFADGLSNRIRWLKDDGHIETVLGNGDYPLRTGGGNALETLTRTPQAVARSRTGTIIFSDLETGSINFLEPDGVQQELGSRPGGAAKFEGSTRCDTEAGDTFGDGGDIRDATFSRVLSIDVVAEPEGGESILIADYDNHRIRRISESGAVDSILGTSSCELNCPGPATPCSHDDECPSSQCREGMCVRFARDTSIAYPWEIQTAPSGNMYVLTKPPTTFDSPGCVLRINIDGTLEEVTATAEQLCNTGADCESSEVCRSSSCLPSCAGAPCGDPSQICIAGACLSRCSSDSSCRSWESCDASGGYCTPRSCDVDLDCGDGGAVCGTFGTCFPRGLVSPSAIAVDAEETLWIADSSDNRIKKLTSDGVLRIVAGNQAGLELSAGRYFTCGYWEGGLASCWGLNDYGQIGIPEPDGVPLRFSQVEAGGYHACGIVDEEPSRLICWGYDNNGLYVPPTPAEGNPFVQVSAGTLHSCAVTQSGTVICWGSNDYGQSTVPTNMGAASLVSAGRFQTCALLTSGELSCWGYNGSGESTPPTGDNYVDVSVGMQHSCALTADKAILCWGLSNDGRTSPPVGSYRSLSVGNEHACAVSMTGAVQCWGKNVLAYSDNLPSSMQRLAAGFTHTCGTNSSGTFVCGGTNVVGEGTPPRLTALLRDPVIANETPIPTVSDIALGPEAETGPASSIYMSHYNDHSLTTVVLAEGPRGNRWERFAGSGLIGHEGDGGLATGARLFYPVGITTAPDGMIVIADRGNRALRTVRSDGIIRTSAGLMHPPMSGLREKTSLPDLRSVAPLADGTFIGSTGYAGRLVHIATSPESRVQILGGYSDTYLTTNPIAPIDVTLLSIQEATGVTADGDGNIYFSDSARGLVYKATRAPNISPSEWPAEILPTTAEDPAALVALPSHELLIADRARHCILAYNLSTAEETILAGTCGIRGYQDGAAEQALFNSPSHLHVSTNGVLYIADTKNHRVRSLHNGQVSTVLGDGGEILSPVLGEAITSSIGQPGAITTDRFGNLFIAAGEAVVEVANIDEDFIFSGLEPALRVFDSNTIPTGNFELACLEGLQILPDLEGLLVVDGCSGKGFELHGVRP